MLDVLLSYGSHIISFIAGVLFMALGCAAKNRGQGNGDIIMSNVAPVPEANWKITPGEQVLGFVLDVHSGEPYGWRVLSWDETFCEWRMPGFSIGGLRPVSNAFGLHVALVAPLPPAPEVGR